MRDMKRHPRSLRRIENFVGNAAWDDFVAWCLRRNLNPVPANAWTLAAYIRSCEGRESLVKLRKRVADIGKAHAEKSKRRPERDPLIAKTFHIIELRARKTDGHSTLFDDDNATQPAGQKKARTRSKPADAPTVRAPKLRVMRSTPRLVARRKPKSG
jgi:hypothetical protein